MVRNTNALKYCLVILFICVLLESVKKSVRECAVCEASMVAFDELLGDPSMQKDVEELLKKVCPKLPAKDRAGVRSFYSFALQPQFGTWPTSMKLSVLLQFSRS
jgi:hypothetical protein